MDWEEMKLSFPGVVPDELLWPLLACLPDHVLWLDTECRVLGSNKSLNPAQSRPLLGRCVLDLLDPLERAKAESAYDEVRTTGKPNSFQARYNDASGQSSLFETFIVPLGAPGDISGFITNSRDVTGASQRDRNLELAVQATGMGIWRFDVRTGAVEWNAEMHRIMGREVPIAPDTYLAEAVHPEDKEQAVAQTRRSFEEGVFGTISHRIVRPDGAVRWVMLVGNMERGAGGALIAAHGVTIDITEQKRQERALLAARRLESVGQLAAGIAHNFNNLLCVIVPALEQWEKSAPEGRLPLVRDARLAADRAAGLVKQLVSFARLSNEELRPCALGRVLDDAVRMSRRIVGDTLTFDVTCSDTELAVLGGEGPLEQALVNLAVNARDAILDGGRKRGSLRIEASTGVLDDLPLVLRDQGDFVRIRVTDDGPGMTPEVRERVFDPFFTTKAPGRGTGLGLSTAYAAIARVGGRMECQSKVGGGTTFSLFVPVHVETDDAVSSARAAPRPSSNGHELRVLVVDDEDIVRRALVSVLSQGGLQVVGARDAAEALEVVQRIEFDVALLDRTMPGMDGIRLAAELHKSHPELRLVLVTGGEVGSHEVMHFEQVMTKPVRSANLLEVVQRLGRKAN